MLLRILNKINKKVNFRLAALFSTIFFITSLILFGTTYFFLSSSLQREDIEAMRLKLLELWTHYSTGGIRKLRDEVTVEKILGEKKIFFVRVADQQNNTLYIFLPEFWRGLDINILKGTRLDRFRKTIRFELQGEVYYLEISSLRLSDGNFIQVGMSVTERVKLLKRFREIFGFVALLMMVLSFTGGSLLTSRILKPIQNLTNGVKSIINTGDFNARIAEKGTKDELGDLVLLVNRMIERIEMLIKGMRGSLDMVAHDLRTPMSRLRGTAEMALGGDGDERTVREALAVCMEESEIILKMLTTLMDISEAETGAMQLNKEIVNMSSLVNDVSDLYIYVAEEKGITVHSKVPDNLTLFVDPNRMRQVLANLLDNALKYTLKGGRVDIETLVNQKKVTIKVKDTGIGISSDDLQLIWNRLYRGEGSGSRPGMGLGLSYVKAIVQAHGGSADVSSKRNEGTVFSISLPVNGSIPVNV
jgi:signal transduction histidine kinase